jgi:hypothetical protein
LVYVLFREMGIYVSKGIIERELPKRRAVCHRGGFEVLNRDGSKEFGLLKEFSDLSKEHGWLNFFFQPKRGMPSFTSSWA